MSKVGVKNASHPIARLCGVKAEDSTLVAAEKALEVMRIAGFSARDIRKAEKLVDQIRKKS